MEPPTLSDHQGELLLTAYTRPTNARQNLDDALVAERRATVLRILRNLEGWYEYRPMGGTDREQQAWVNGWNEARQSIIEEAQRLGILTPADRAILDEEAAR